MTDLPRRSRSRFERLHRPRLLDRASGSSPGIYALFALGLQLNVGYTGIVNFGQAGFMAIGAYAMASSSSRRAGRSGWRCPRGV